jgi:hypothetical protein
MFSVLTPELLEELQLLSPKFQLKSKPVEEGLPIKPATPVPEMASPSAERKSLLGSGTVSPMGGGVLKGNPTIGSKLTQPPATTVGQQPAAASSPMQSSAQMTSTSNPATPGDNRVFPPEVEDLANAYFQKIYTGQISIEDIVNILKKFKNSKEQK